MSIILTSLRYRRAELEVGRLNEKGSPGDCGGPLDIAYCEALTAASREYVAARAAWREAVDGSAYPRILEEIAP